MLVCATWAGAARADWNGGERCGWSGPPRPAWATARLGDGMLQGESWPDAVIASGRTLLFLGTVGWPRPRDLRPYIGTGVALRRGRPQAYGYRTVARFRRAVAAAGGPDPHRCPGRLDYSPVASRAHAPPGQRPPSRSIDGQRKAVSRGVLLPRGLVGRRGTVLGGRALILLHDTAGHPLVVTTQRGAVHRTGGVPAFLARYEAHNPPLCGVISEREGMAAGFLAPLARAGRQIVTLLRRDQYVDLCSFNLQRGRAVRALARGPARDADPGGRARALAPARPGSARRAAGVGRGAAV